MGRSSGPRSVATQEDHSQEEQGAERDQAPGARLLPEEGIQKQERSGECEKKGGETGGLGPDHEIPGVDDGREGEEIQKPGGDQTEESRSEHEEKNAAQRDDACDHEYNLDLHRLLIAIASDFVEDGGNKGAASRPEFR